MLKRLHIQSNLRRFNSRKKKGVLGRLRVQSNFMCSDRRKEKGIGRLRVQGEVICCEGR